METNRYIFAVALSLPLAALIFLIEGLRLFPQGTVVGSAELTFELAATVALLHPRFLSLKLPTRVSLLLFFGCLFIADANYIRHFFVSNRSTNDLWVALSTKIPYSIAFLAAGTAMISAASPRDLVRCWTLPACIAIVLPIALKFIILPFISQLVSQPLGWIGLIEALDIASLLALLIVSLVTYLSSRSLYWSFFGAALVTLVLGDWAIRVETLLTSKTTYGTYEFLWGYGVFLSTVPILFGKELPRSTEAFSNRSLLNSFKLTSLLLSFIPLFFICIAQNESVATIKIIAIGIPLVLIFSVLWSHQYLSTLSQLSMAVGDVISGRLKPVSAEHLPLELRPVLSQVAQQANDTSRLAHDIRSPLSAISCTLSSCSEIREDAMRLMKAAINRVQDIATQKLSTKEHPNAVQLLENIVAEKRALWAGSKVDIFHLFLGDSRSFNSTIPSTDLERALSNLLDNAKEAVGEKGAIEVRAKVHNGKLTIEIRDSGVGIPREILNQVGQRGFTYGKANGNGLGFHSSRTTIESAGGQLTIDSIPEKGTTVLISLPQAV